jgi:hypothetical protein
MVAFLCGELTNSATYFCSFANISSKDATDINGQFGKEKDKKGIRGIIRKGVEVAKSVETFKQTVTKQNIAESTKRSKVTNFIAGKRSRQEFKPLLGQMVDSIHIDPLHLKNNACALAHRLLLQEVLLISQLPSAMKSFFQVPNTSPFHRYIDAMRTKCNLRRLANKIGYAGCMLLVARCCWLQDMYKVLEIFMLGVEYDISWVESYVRHQKFYNICIVFCIF